MCWIIAGCYMLQTQNLLSKTYIESRTDSCFQINITVLHNYALVTQRLSLLVFNFSSLFPCVMSITIDFKTPPIKYIVQYCKSHLHAFMRANNKSIQFVICLHAQP